MGAEGSGYQDKIEDISKIPVWKCLKRKCGHSWIGRVAHRPAICPACKRSDWDKAPNPAAGKAVQCKNPKCYHIWVTLVAAPKRCPDCKRTDWNQKR